MTNVEIEQIVQLLVNQGFRVEWIDPVAETFLVRLQPVRGAA